MGEDTARCGYSKCRAELPAPGMQGGRPRSFCRETRWDGGRTCSQMARAEREALGALGLDAGSNTFRLDAERLREHLDNIRGPVDELTAALAAVTTRLDEVEAAAVAAVDAAHGRVAEAERARVAAEEARESAEQRTRQAVAAAERAAKDRADAVERAAAAARQALESTEALGAARQQAQDAISARAAAEVQAVREAERAGAAEEHARQAIAAAEQHTRDLLHTAEQAARDALTAAAQDQQEAVTAAKAEAAQSDRRRRADCPGADRSCPANGPSPSGNCRSRRTRGRRGGSAPSRRHRAGPHRTRRCPRRRDLAAHRAGQASPQNWKPSEPAPPPSGNGRSGSTPTISTQWSRPGNHRLPPMTHTPARP